MRKLKWGVLGAGGIADRRSIPGMMQSESAVLAAIMEINPELAGRIGTKYGVGRIFTDERDLVADPEVEAVYIASPVEHHDRQAMLAIAAGKPFLIEKPLALDAARAGQVAAAAQAANIPAACGLMMRFGSWNQKIRTMVQAGQFGRLVSAKVQFTCWYPDIPGAWRQSRATSGGGSLMDMGVHCIDLIQYITGQPAVQVAALIDTMAFNYDVEDEATLLLSLADGTHVQVEASFCIPDAAAHWRLELAGTRGSMVADNTIGQVDGGSIDLRLQDQDSYDASQEKAAVHAAGSTNVTFGNLYARQFDSFSRSVLENLPVAVPLQDAVQVQRVVEAAYRSAREGRFMDCR